MNIVAKRFEVVEVYIEDKNYNLVNDKAREYRTNGFAVTNPTTHYGKHGREADRMYWIKGTKKVEIN